MTFTQLKNLHLRRLSSLGLGKPSLKGLGLPFVERSSCCALSFALGLFLTVVWPVIAKRFS